MSVVAGQKVEPWNDALWRIIRERDGVPDDFLSDPDHLEPFKSGGGKGGALLAFTKDRRFIVKEVSGGDHKVLMHLAGNYVERIKDGKTLLCTIYMHYTELEGTRTYMVMSNLLKHSGPYEGLYDLKGCSDDKTLMLAGREVQAVHKRIWQLHLWCGRCAWSADRKAYHQGKVSAREMRIVLTDAQQAAITDLLKQDTAWLAANSLMDYSLLVCTKRVSWAEFEADKLARQALHSPPGLRQPMPHHVDPDSRGKGDVMLIYVGIIDFLQSWTCGKRVAMGLKVLERNKATIPPSSYATRFATHFCESIEGGAAPIEAEDVGEEQADDQGLYIVIANEGTTRDVCM